MTGIFTRNVNGRKYKKGTISGNRSPDGYINIKLNGKHYPAHRLAWLYMTGNFPKERIDHINMAPDDNRFINLREATCSENMFNAGRWKNNTVGIKGVCKRKNKFRAQAKYQGKYYFLGDFVTPQEAGKAYQKFAREHHGEFLHEST